MVRRLVDDLIVCWILAFAAFLLTGGWELTFAGIHVSSHRASSLLIALGWLALIRLALTLGLKGSLVVAASTALALAVGEVIVRWVAPVPEKHRLIEIHRPSDVSLRRKDRFQPIRSRPPGRSSTRARIC